MYRFYTSIHGKLMVTNSKLTSTSTTLNTPLTCYTSQHKPHIHQRIKQANGQQQTSRLEQSELQTAKESDKKRHAEIDNKAVKNRQNDIGVARRARNDRQRCVHGGSPSGRNRGKASEPTDEKRSTKQSQQLTRYVGKQGHSAKLRATVFSDENARKRIIAEAGTHGKTVGQATARKQQTGNGHSAKRTGHSDKRQEKQARTD